MKTLEHQLSEIAEQYDLSSLSIHIYAKDGKVFFGAYAHGTDNNGIIQCAGSDHKPELKSVMDHVGNAIGLLNAKRYTGIEKLEPLMAARNTPEDVNVADEERVARDPYA